MQIVPLDAVASQSLTASLGGQQCAINVYQKSTGMFFDLSIGGVAVVTAMLCMDRVGLVQQPYLGFVGQLAFVDTQGTSDPEYTGLGSRYILTYTP